MMFLHRSNRSERLVDELSAVVRRPLRDPLGSECIVVQSQGMERWLAMELCTRLGVWANAEFPFPRHMVERVSLRLLGAPSAQSTAFSERTMLWAIAALLPEQLKTPEFAPVANYLEDDPRGVQRIALAQRIAHVFDDYTVYRPELLLRWEQGEEQHWEARLWRALCERLGQGHQATRMQRLLAALEAPSIELEGLPERICLFGISSLPPLYLRILAALSRHIEAHLFVLSPTREYYGDLRKRRALDAPEDGHPLLASLGRLGREFQDLLEECTGSQYQEREDDLYEDPGTACLLHALQSDILHLRNRGAIGGADARLSVKPDDRSVEIEICHSPMREVEILHDQLLALLEDKTLAAHDIVVMAPDIEIYAPIVEAVFEQRGRPFIPYSVSDRGARTSHEVIDAFYALMEVLAGRLPANAVLDLLSYDCIRQRFQIEAEEIDTLRAWMTESGIRFCVDEAQRAEIGQPELRGNTWRFGLDRMLLGYAMEGKERALYAGVLPYDEIEGSVAKLLGKLCDFCDRLFRHRTQVAPKTLPEWRELCSRLLGDMFAIHAGTTHQRNLIASALSALCEDAQAAGFGEAIERQAFLGQLQKTLDDRLPSRGLLARGVTFCQLVPMRSIPFQVVCLLGMNDDAFPGQSPILGFDRIAEKRSAGDRSRRDDDRYMFLEALLSARRKLLISYLGHSIHDNREMQPSVVVGELMDCIRRGFEPATEAPSLQAQLCVEQRLHAFYPGYFDGQAGARLFSYAGDYCEGARVLHRERNDPALLVQPLPESVLRDELTVEELIAWVTKPIRTFLRRSLGVYLEDEMRPLADREPIRLNELERWQVGMKWLAMLLDGVAPEEVLRITEASGVLPLGTSGRQTFDMTLPAVQALAHSTRAYRQGERLKALPIALEIEGVRVSGALDRLWPRAHLFVTYSTIDGDGEAIKAQEFEHFLRHVLLNHALDRFPQAGCPRDSYLVARSEQETTTIHYGPLADAREILRTLMGFAKQAQSLALPFVCEPSFAYAASLRKGESEDKARHAAAIAFKPRFAEAYRDLVYPDPEALFRTEGPLGFAALARQVCEPLLRCRSTR